MTDLDVDVEPYQRPADPPGVLEGVPAPGPWARLGRCRTAPPELFFPERGDDLRQAKAICRSCPVINECRDYAVPHRDLLGVWGGLSAKERSALRRAAQSEPSADSAAHPPAAQRSENGALYAVLEQLTAHPGRWAKVGHFASPGSAATTASLLRTGDRPAPPGPWEFDGRRNPDGGSDLYACHHPNETARAVEAEAS